MSTTPARQPLHPMLWVAAASVTAVSLAGVAKLTGILPGSDAPTPPPAVVSTAPAVVAQAQADLPVATPPHLPRPVDEPPSVVPAPREPVHHTKPAPAHEPSRAVATKPPAGPAVAKGNPPPADAVPAPPQTPPPAEHAARRVTDTAPPVCRECGVIENVEAIQQKGEGSGIGAVGGAILGGVLGHQVGEGSGKQLARIGGAVLGGFAGNEAERRYRTVSHYQITVRLEDGTRRVIEQQSAPAWHVGDPVRIRNGEIVAAGAAPSRRDSSSF